MATVGCLGDIVFTVSDKVVRTLDNFKWSGSARYTTHQIHRGNALTEFTGIDPDKISFDMTFRKELGVDPLKEVVKIWNYERGGIAVPLVLGEKAYGKYRWNVVSHDLTAQYTDRDGNIIGAVVSVTLQEYLK